MIYVLKLIFYTFVGAFVCFILGSYSAKTGEEQKEGCFPSLILGFAMGLFCVIVELIASWVW